MIDRKHFFFFLKLCVSAGLIALILWSVGLENLLGELRAVAPATVLVALLLGLIQVGFVAGRWFLVIRALGEKLSFWPAFRITFIGSFFNQTLPSSVGGDVFRVYLAYKQGLLLSRAVTSVLLERVLTMVGLLLLAVLFLPLLAGRSETGTLAPVLPFVLLIALGAIVGIGLLSVLDRLPAEWRRFRLVRALAHLSSDARRLFFSPGNAIVPLGAVLLSLLNLTFMIWVLAQGLGMELSFLAALALFPLVLLATAIPVSVGGWGVREGAMVAVLALIGVSAPTALALSVLFGLVGILGSLPGGLIWLAHGYGREDIAVAEKTAAESG